MVHGLEIVEVVGAVGQLRRVHAIDEIVVGGEGYRMQPAGLELEAQSFADRGLAAARRAGDEDEADALPALVPAFDFFGDLHYLLLLQRLGYLDEVGGLSSQDGFVDIPDSVEAHDPVPFLGLGEHLEGLGLLEEGRQLIGGVAVRNAEEHPAAVGRELPDLQLAGARDERVVVVVGRVPPAYSR